MLGREDAGGRQGPVHVRQANRRRILVLRASVCLVAGGLYALGFVVSVHALNAQDLSSQESVASRTYFTTLLDSIGVASHGANRTLVDTSVPVGIVAPEFAPYNQLSSALPVLRQGIVFGELGAKTFTVAPNGALVPIRFERISGSREGLPIRSVVGSSGATPAPSTPRGTGRCFRIGPTGAVVHILLSSHLDTPSAWLVLELDSSPGGVVIVSTLKSGVPQSVGAVDVTSSPRIRNYLLPLSKRTLDQVDVFSGTAGANVCVGAVDVGMLSSTAP